MERELYQQVLDHGAAVDLSRRAKWKLTGADRVRYLNGQVTQDVRLAGADRALYACVTDVKGRMCGDIFIHSTESALLLDAEEALRESLGARLDRYIVADDVELADVTENWSLWHVFGADLPKGVACERFGTAGVDVWLPVGSDYVPTHAVLSAEDAETWRILQKVPRWGHELTSETFPPEAGLEQRAMSFTKGCYIGQEVLSRIKTTGKMPRQMVSLESEAPLKAGDAWQDGVVTSVARHPIQGLYCGLAMTRQSR